MNKATMATSYAEKIPFTQQVVVAVFCKNRHILVQQRAGTSLRYFWEFPGGKVEPGESLENALRRECEEELGAQVHINRWLHTYQDSTAALILYFYVVTFLKQPAAFPPHPQVWTRRWHAAIDLPNLRFCPADLGMVQYLAKHAW